MLTSWKNVSSVLTHYAAVHSVQLG